MCNGLFEEHGPNLEKLYFGGIGGIDGFDVS